VGFFFYISFVFFPRWAVLVSFAWGPGARAGGGGGGVKVANPYVDQLSLSCAKI
jgi:hypothetical protein